MTTMLACAALLLAAGGCVSRNVERVSAEEAAKMPPPPEPLSPEQRAASVAAVPGVEGTISLGEELGGTAPSGTLFVILRVSGRSGGPPLAVKQVPPEFPVSFRITEADSMIPGTPLVGDLDVIVRLDQDGNAFTTEPGDLSGRVGPVQVGSSVEITLHRATQASATSPAR